MSTVAAGLPISLRHHYAIGESNLSFELTRAGFDHENSPPDRAKDTQSAGVPVEQKSRVRSCDQSHRWSFVRETKETLSMKYNLT